MTRRRNAYFGILAFWAGGTILVLTIALSSHCRRQELEDRRDDQVRNMCSEIAGNSESSFLVDPDALPVSGEEEDWSDYDVYSSSEMTSTSGTGDISADTVSSFSTSDGENDAGSSTSTDDGSSAEGYTLTAYGTISIPSIECEIPL